MTTTPHGARSATRSDVDPSNLENPPLPREPSTHHVGIHRLLEQCLSGVAAIEHRADVEVWNGPSRPRSRSDQ
jgi:hypothetical protein